MAVTAASEHRSTHLGNTYLFCSTGCKAKFDADPARYASGDAGIGTGSGHAPHHHASTAVSPAPAASPTAPGTIYTCPMHPEIRQDHPGTCPKCGMTLEPLLPDLDDDNPELRDFSRRFWWTLPLTLVVLALAMLGERLHLMDMAT
ncbi:heavy metal-binding domain-containing protein, partial [Pseudomonas aeruginosa]